MPEQPREYIAPPMTTDLTPEQPTPKEMLDNPNFALGGLIALAEHHFKQTSPQGVHLRAQDFGFLVAYIRQLQREKQELEKARCAGGHCWEQTGVVYPMNPPSYPEVCKHCLAKRTAYPQEPFRYVEH